MHNGLAALARRFAAAAAMLGSLTAAQASSVSLPYLEGQMPMAPDAVATLGPDLFGDKVNLFNGALEFEQVDLSLPGNFALPVALGRRYAPGRMTFVRGAFGDWDLDVPRISGTFSRLGWVTSTGGSNRCSGYSLPPAVNETGYGAGGALVSVGFAPSDYWQGNFLHVPGHGGQELLRRGAGYTAQPADGHAWPLVTRNQWQLSCLSSVQNHPGEGFVAISPEGVRYRFDWMAVRPLAHLRKAAAPTPRYEYFLYATEVSDRFGNWVRYTYSAANPMHLQRIESKDGRVITLQYSNGRVSSATDGTRTIHYSYTAQADLQYVNLPDGSRWTFDLGGMLHPLWETLGEGAKCDSPGVFPTTALVGRMTHPSGAHGVFHVPFAPHGRTFVEQHCWYVHGTSGQTTGAVWPRLTRSQTLTRKEIQGPGLGTGLVWIYQYASQSGWTSCTTCSDRKTVTVTHPDGSMTRHTFGNRWRVNEGQLLQLDEGWNGSSALRTTTFGYRHPVSQLCPERFGTTPLPTSDWLAAANRPQDLRSVVQQGTTFTWQVDSQVSGFDAFCRPTKVAKFSTLGDSRTESTEYEDHFGAWVLGQVKRVTEVSQSPHREMEAYTYYTAHAMRQTRSSFGLQVESYEYNGTDGTLSVLRNAGGRPIALSSYRRGAPEGVAFVDNATESQRINNLGRPEWRTNAAGTTHNYGYDAMGRLARIDYPTGDAVAYHPTLVGFEQIGHSEWGLAPGHWRQTITTGNETIVRYFDVLWRERVRHRYDSTNPEGTSVFTETRYDHRGSKTFVSYPTRSFADVDVAKAGRATVNDALGRVILVTEDSELGVLRTETEYVSPGFRRKVTDPRGHVTTYSFQAFDTPSEDSIRRIELPQGVLVRIDRDIFGKATAITREGPYGGSTLSATRRYVYDAHQRLCKTIEPETGATIQAYDASSNVAWRASGLALTSPTACNQSEVPNNRKVTFGYNTRERLTSTTYGDGSYAVGRSYEADGLLRQIWTPASTWTYSWNNARLLVNERLSFGGQNHDFGRTVDAHRNLAAVSYPGGPNVAYAPNALGQPTQAGSYASEVTWHPNGMLAGYRLGNLIRHTLGQNVRGLPEDWVDQGAQTVLSDRYLYDANGNVTSITDGLGGANSRSMAYDGLDRLITTNGPWGSGSFGYDPLDNLRSSTLGSRVTVASYGAGNLLTQLSVNGQASLLGYDDNGNVVTHGNRGYGFDIGNRLLWSTTPQTVSYHYDGHGRRLWSDGGSWNRLQAYSLAGQLLLNVHSTQGSERYIYLGSRLIAEVTGTGVTRYVHSDALGSPVARTNTSGQVLGRTVYEPYGSVHSGTVPQGVGYTGHFNDVHSGLVYMQQRYFEPAAGRFLSVDPVVTDAQTGGFFNRYVYALNNPYKFIDPTGMAPNCSNTGASMCTSTGSLSGGADTVASAAAAAMRAMSSAMTGGYSDLANQAAASGDGLAATGYTLAGTAFAVGNAVTLGNGSRMVGLFGLAAKGVQAGSFSLISWAKYPSWAPKPDGTLRVLSGAEYDAARSVANSANAALRRADPGAYAGKQIHEILPVKFGGSPIDPANKIALPPGQHAELTNFWNQLLRDVK